MNPNRKRSKYSSINIIQNSQRQTIEHHHYNLLLKLKVSQCTQLQKQQIYQYLSKTFFKPLYSQIPYQIILPYIKLYQWDCCYQLFNEGQKIQNIYFLLEGNINLYKKNQFIINKIGPNIVGQSLLSHNTTRYYRAQIGQFQPAKGFILPKKIFDTYCNSIMKQYHLFLQYLCNFANISENQFNFDNINISQDIKIKTALYGYNLKFENQLNIIYQGQCLMNFAKINNQGQGVNNFLPYKVIKNKKDKYYPLVKLEKNQCFGMENLQNDQAKMQKLERMTKKIIQQNNSLQQITNDNNQSNLQAKRNSPLKLQRYKTQIPQRPQLLHNPNPKFQYIVSSQKLIYISISLQKLKLFPQKFMQKFQYVHELHLQKLKSNKYYQASKLFKQKDSNIQNKSKIKLNILSLKKKQQRYQNNDNKISSLNSNSFNQSIIINQSTLEQSKLNQINSAHVQTMFNQISTISLRNNEYSSIKSNIKLKNPKLKQIKNNQNPFINKNKHKNKFILQQPKMIQMVTKSCDVTLLNKHQKQLSQEQVMDFKRKYCLGYELKVQCQYQIQNAIHQVNCQNKSKSRSRSKQNRQILINKINYENVLQNLQKSMKIKQVKQFKGYFPQIKNRKNLKENQKKQIVKKYNQQFQKKRKQWIYYILAKKNKA